MKGNWSDNDFAGFSIYGKTSVDNNWWNSPSGFMSADGKKIKSNSTITSGTDSLGYGDNLICKKYPEKDSPFNFTDKYATEFVSGHGYGYYCSGNIYTSLQNCTDSCYFGSSLPGLCINGDGGYKCCVSSSIVINNTGYGLPFDVYKNKNLRTYFKSVNSGLSVMEHRLGVDNSWSATNPIRYVISDNQECYYEKATYNGLYTNQYYMPGVKAFDEVCEERGGVIGPNNYSYECYITESNSFSKNSKLKEVVDYSKSDTESNYRLGYCLEFDYSQELYYPGSGKYNCINWMPGFTK